jgi:hypothetical protein
MSTENIVRFLQTAYSDEKLSELLAHAQDGKLCWSSCCCFVGVLTADHALRGWAGGVKFDPISTLPRCSEPHYLSAKEIPGAKEAEKEFKRLGDDYDRRAAIIPLILAEMERRETAEQYRMEEEAAAEEGAAIEASNFPYPEYERNGR